MSPTATENAYQLRKSGHGLVAPRKPDKQGDTGGSLFDPAALRARIEDLFEEQNRLAGSDVLRLAVLQRSHVPKRIPCGTDVLSVFSRALTASRSPTGPLVACARYSCPATSRAGRLRLSFHVSHRGQDVERSATVL